MADVAQPHHKRPWYKRPPVWIAFVVVAGLLVFSLMKMGGGPATIGYGEFLHQLDAGNVASVTFSGTQIDGQFKQKVARSGGDQPLTVFRSRAPDFGDPTLVPQLRKAHVPIGVVSSQGVGLGGMAIAGALLAFLLAKPMLLIVAAALVAGLFRVARGGSMDMHSILSMVPMFGMVSGQNGEKTDSAGDTREVRDVPAPKEPGVADTGQHHCSRPWYLRPPVWVLGALLLGLVAFGVSQVINRPAAMPYGEFLDQLAAGNIASVIFQGTEIDGRVKHAFAAPAAKSPGPQDVFRSRVPDVGDPTLLSELRKQQVTIDVASSSSWGSWLARMPWPMLLIIGAVLVIGWMKFKPGARSPGDAAATAHQMPMMRAMSAIFGKPDQAAGDPRRPPHQ